MKDRAYQQRVADLLSAGVPPEKMADHARERCKGVDHDSFLAGAEFAQRCAAVTTANMICFMKAVCACTNGRTSDPTVLLDPTQYAEVETPDWITEHKSRLAEESGE